MKKIFRLLIAPAIAVSLVVLAGCSSGSGYTEADLRSDFTKTPEIFMVLCDTLDGGMEWTPSPKIIEAIGEERAQAILREECEKE